MIFKKVALISKPNDSDVAETLGAVIGYLSKNKLNITVDAAASSMIDTSGCNVAEIQDIKEDTDLAIIVGGDGTLLAAAQHLAPLGIPICGINRGRLGFLVDISPKEITAALDGILNGKFTLEERIALQAKVERDGKTVSQNNSYNDVVVHCRDAVRLIELHNKIDGAPLNTLSADGLIVATPTCSTAYALSCGGPIIQPTLDSLVLVPISPHILSNRPIVVNAKNEIEIMVSKNSRADAVVSFDGHIHFPLELGDKVTIRKDSAKLKLAQPLGHDYLDILRKKLSWSI